MYSFGSNGRMNVGTMDTLIDTEYERCDSQVITDNVIYDTFSICDANIAMKTDIWIASSKVFSNSENSMFILFPERLPVIAKTLIFRKFLLWLLPEEPRSDYTKLGLENSKNLTTRFVSHFSLIFLARPKQNYFICIEFLGNLK